MARGKFRIKGEPDLIQVQFGPFSRPIPENEYRANGYEPSLESLNWLAGSYPKSVASQESKPSMAAGYGGAPKDD